MSPRNLKTTVSALTFIILLWAASALANPKVLFYYFDPDSPQRNLARLMEAMDDFLGEANSSFSFQPFTHLEDFDERIHRDRPAFVLIPSWYLKSHRDELGLLPLLEPVSKGESGYRKYLLSTAAAGEKLTSLKGKTLAMTTLGKERTQLLNSLLFSRLGLDARDLNIVTVPKDSDALLAVALNQVDLALVSDMTLERAKATSPRIGEAVKVVSSSNPIAKPVVAYMKDIAEEREVRRLLEMFTGPEAKGRGPMMVMLQVDAWRKTNE